MSPYDSVTFLDGTKVFKSSEATRLEGEVAKLVEAPWNCRIISFAKLCPIDWYAERDNRMVAVLELKSRDIKHDRYETVFLAVRKWLALAFGQFGMGCPAIFVVRFTDGVYWVPWRKIDPRRFCISGRTDRGADNDIEPLIEVPIAAMNKLSVEAAA